MTRLPTPAAPGLASILPDMPAGSLALAAAVAATAASAAHPDALLLDLVTAYFAAEAERVTVFADADAAFARYAAPPVPSALLQKPNGGDGWWGLLGRPLESTTVDGERRRFYSSEDDVPRLRQDLAARRPAGIAPHLIERADAILAALDIYVPAVERAQDEAGITLFNQQADAIEARKDALLRQIAITPATTPEGLRAKARAAIDDMSASGAAWLSDQHIPALLASRAIADVHPPLSLAAVFSLAVDAARLGAAQEAGR